jgi:HD-GYP domain-containing protein (c-di-GMP phosphodiesterase class II)
MATSLAVPPVIEEQVFLLGSAATQEEIRRALRAAPDGAGLRLEELDHLTDFDPRSACVLVGDSSELFQDNVNRAIQKNLARVIFALDSGSSQLPPQAARTPIFGFLTRPMHPQVTESLVQAAFENMRLSRSRRRLERDLEKAYEDIFDLNAIGAALSAERDTAKLLNLILQKSREITTSDAGALYLVEENDKGDKVLRFTLTQNDSLEVPFNSFTIPIDKSRISSYVALTGETLHIEDAYRLPPGVPYGFSRDFDQRIGYRTKSVLAVPMKNHKGEIVGVLQLINHKPDWNLKVTRENAEEFLRPYPERSIHLVTSLASQAAVALENNRLIEDIQNLFEGFVKASVIAIEARDPTTSGHSFRVRDLTVALAEAVDRLDTGPYAGVHFTREQIREIRYASVLHDFGKVGVREHVLVKANKLYPQQLEVVQQRFDYVRKAIQEENSRRRLQYVLEKGREEYQERLGAFDAELAERLKEMDEFMAFVLECNKPTVLPEGNFAKLQDVAARQFLAWDGSERALLTPDETRLLQIPKGSLDESERREIESHVVHTFNFLVQIPWTKEMRGIPEIARAHHEKLNGSGYPFKLKAEEIPVQSRMMTISDIYDALSASDRPYKRALPPEKALSIIGSEVKSELLDEALYQVFLEGKIWTITQPKP